MLVNTPICDFNWVAPNFRLPDPKGATHSLLENMGDNGLLIAFICNHCPYVKVIAERFAEDARELQEMGINVLAIMSNDYRKYPEDSPENMLLFAEQHAFHFPYLVDENQAVARAYGAVCTPDFFGINTDRKLCYRGRLDDAAHQTTRTNHTKRELLNAMQLVAKTNTGPKHQIPSMGCSIKWID